MFKWKPSWKRLTRGGTVDFPSISEDGMITFEPCFHSAVKTYGNTAISYLEMIAAAKACESLLVQAGDVMVYGAYGEKAVARCRALNHLPATLSADQSVMVALGVGQYETIHGMIKQAIEMKKKDDLTDEGEQLFVHRLSKTHPGLSVAATDKLLRSIEQNFSAQAEHIGRFMSTYKDLMPTEAYIHLQDAKALTAHYAEVAKNLEPASDQSWSRV